MNSETNTITTSQQTTIDFDYYKKKYNEDPERPFGYKAVRKMRKWLHKHIIDKRDNRYCCNITIIVAIIMPLPALLALISLILTIVYNSIIFAIIMGVCYSFISFIGILIGIITFILLCCGRTPANKELAQLDYYFDEFETQNDIDKYYTLCRNIRITFPTFINIPKFLKTREDSCVYDGHKINAIFVNGQIHEVKSIVVLQFQ